MESCPWGEGGRAVLCNNGSMLLCKFTDIKMMGCDALLFSRYFPTFRNICAVTFTLDEKDSSTLKLGTVTYSKVLYLSIKLHGVICQETVILMWDPRISNFNYFLIYPKLVCF
jgi:hypothetical protein